MSLTFTVDPTIQEQTSTHEYQPRTTQSRWLLQFADKWSIREHSRIAASYWQTETKPLTTFEAVSAKQSLVSVSEYRNLPTLDLSAKYMALLIRLIQSTQIPIVSQSLRTTAVGLFSSIHEVDAIYQQALDSEIAFWVFVDNEEYDDELMDLLISREEELMDTFQEISIMVRFVPSVLCDNYEEVVGTSAQLIFKR